MQNSLIYNNGNGHNYPTSLLKRLYPCNNPGTLRKGYQDCMQLGYQYTSLPGQGQVLGVVIIRLQLLNTFYLPSSLVKLWNPFVNTNINLDLILHQTIALTYLSTTMLASCYGSPIYVSKCCDIVGFHSEVCIIPSMALCALSSGMSPSYLSRSVLDNPLQSVAHCICSLTCNKRKRLSHLVESYTETGATFMNETLVNRT